ncbi:hypothetical protein GDO81_015756 [Engystomops pustulosus]|nr:hypothetical protein GDO81_015756 [Engystomops pustulosus]
MPIRFYLTVNREDGSASVLVAENLDYETTKNFVLKIRAQNVAAVPLAAFTTVYINITDVNDNVPFFSSSIYEASVTEGLDLGTFVLQVSASDQDLGLNGKITYSILEDRSGDHALFHIAPQTGSIYTAAVFDREEKTSYLLEVKSSDGSESARPGKHGQPNSDTAYVRIFIIDVNDNQPSFTQRAYFVSVDEDQDVGSVVVTVSANDPDEGMNANIRYQITAGNIGGVLELNPETGAILIVHPLDYEEVKVYVLTLLASDGKWEDFATVTINVLNKNDEPPVFSLNEYRGSVTEEMADLPVFVLQVSATDPDHDQPGGLKYSLHGSGAENLFTIDEKTGSVFAMKPLDREEHAIWRFVVLATDDEGDGLTGFTDVIIYVQDINDNTPQFVCSFNMCNGSVVENSPPNTSIMEMSAIDLDDKNDGINAILAYSILSNPLDVSGLEMFNINHHTGTIYTSKGNLDREKNDSLKIVVEVKDGGGLTSTATATIAILDTNDHAPKFTQEMYSVAILETTEVNSTVLQVFAVDEDIGENALVTFSIIGGDPDHKFFIENPRKNHQAEIKLKKKLDYENPQERLFNLRIKVEDRNFSSISDCEIELQDANDNPPVFSQSLIKVDPFYENITVGSIIANVTATDADSGKNGHVIYSIEPDSDVLGQFLVDQVGNIMVSKTLDREVLSAYSLVLLATDKGSPEQTATMTVFLNLLDVNDNGPMFDGLYLPVVWENTAFPQTLRLNDSSYLLHATDLDTPKNGPPFHFSLPTDQQNSTDFLLVDHDDNTASVQALRIFDRENEKEFHLYVIITDSGLPPMSATNTLTITIGDENDHAHQAGHKEVYIYVHGAAIRSPVDVGKVFAPDEDDWDNKTFSAISEIPVHFHLDNNTGTLQLLEKCDPGIYNLKVKVSDGVWPDVVSTVRLHVKEIQSDTIYNSVSLILTNVTAEEFIVKDDLGHSKEDLLRKVLAEIIPARAENIQIFSLQGEGTVTEVRLAILDSSSSRHQAHKLQSMIFTNKHKIQAAMKTQIFPGEAEFCLRTVCLRGAGHSCHRAVPDWPVLVDGGSISFVSVIHNWSIACRCPPPGRAQHSCFTLPQNPCLNGGTCVDTTLGYRCRCESQFFGPLCQLTLRSFHTDGFASFPPIRFCLQNHLSIDFVTDEPEGILLYHGPLTSPSLGNSDNFLSIALLQGIPSLKIGHVNDFLHLQLPDNVNVSDGKWHRIDLRVKKKDVIFTLDRCSSAIIIEKEGVGKRLLSEDRAVCEVVGVMPKEWRVWNPHHNLWLGGFKSSSTPDSTNTHFKGCLRNLIVNKEMYDFGDALESVSSSPGCTACDTISSTQCEAKSSCTGELDTSRSSLQECEKAIPEYFFQSGSFIQYKFPHAFNTQRMHFQIMVRTRQSNSIILSVSSQDQTEYIILQITHGILAVSYNIGDGDFIVRLPNHRVDSGEWQEITLERMQNEFSLHVYGGGEHKEITAAHGTYKEIKVDPRSIVLGSGNLQALSFQGCIKNARLNNYELPMENQSSTPVAIIGIHGVSKGCVSEVCKSQPCDRGFICTDLWMIHECRCPPGYLLMENNTGQWCLYTVCMQGPCKHGTCIPQTPAEYTCLCPQGYGGSKCDIHLYGLDPGLGLSTFLIICICSAALLALIAGALLFSHCNKKRRINEGVYHVSSYKDEPEDTRQNIFHYNEEGGGEEDQDAFSMTDLQLSLQSSPAQSLCRRMREQHINGPLSCDYGMSDSQKVTSQVPVPKTLSCSFTGGDFEQYFYDVCQDTAYMRASCDSLKVYDTEGTGSPAGSLSTLASSGLDSDLEYEDLRTWGPKFSYLCKLYSYTEDDDP